MKIIRDLHGAFTGVKGATLAFFESVERLLIEAVENFSIMADMFAITTSSGELLDLWGIDLDTPRLPGEDDESYRERLKSAYNGDVVTKFFLELMVDRHLSVLGFAELCEIYEWFEREAHELPPGWFKVGLPLKFEMGWFSDHTAPDLICETPHVYEGFVGAEDDYLHRLRIPDIRKLLNEGKASGVQYKIFVESVEVT